MPARKTTRRKPVAPTARKLGAYSAHFSKDEQERIISALDAIEFAAGIDAVAEATYVLLDRIIARLTSDDDSEPDVFLKLVKAHNETTGRIAQLAHARQLVSDDATDRIASALDDLAQQLKLDL